jgi:cytochrome c553
MRKLTIAFCALLTSSATVYAESSATAVVGDVEAGKAKSAVCAGCHGENGNSTNPLWPKLAGQHAEYIVEQLRAFKSDVRVEPSMTGMAKPLSEQDMLNLGAYYASRKGTVGTVAEEFMTSGERIYRGGNRETGVPACSACHGPSGKGNGPSKYPSLSGQHAAYAKKQLEDYKSGARGKSGNPGIMYDIAKKMSPEEIEAVANFVQGLH